MLKSRQVVINTRSLSRRISGVERYTGELVSCLGGRLRRERPGKPLRPVQGHLWEQAILPTRLKKGELLWSPANTGPLAVERQVLSLHDVSVLDYPEWFQPGFALWYRLLLPHLVRRARRVLTVSEYSRGRILQRLGLPPDKVSVVHAGVNLLRFHPGDDSRDIMLLKQYQLDHPYLLFVGTLEPRKNLGRLVQAWLSIQKGFPNFELVICGARSANFAEILPASSPERIHPSIRYLGYVPDDDLPSLYREAEVFLLPSLEEGFGLGMLEAMACGTPVIASHAGALPEVAGEAALLVHPLNVSAWASAMGTLLSDTACRTEYRQRGLQHVQGLTWEKAAGRIWQVLESVSIER